MQKKGANISLKGYDDIFSTDQSRAEAQQERVQEIPLSELHPFEGHPFRVVDDEEMMKTAESVRDFGVLTPAIVRPDPDGGYEIVSGHRRHRASELAGKETMPAIVRDLDDDAAIILMVDANLQRESRGSGTGCRYYGIHLRSAGNGKNAWGTSSDHLLYRCQ